MESITIPVEGMTCGGCVSSVQRALGRMLGVASAAASLEARQVTVNFDPARVLVDDLVQGIEDAGYGVPSAWRGAVASR